MSGDDFVMTYPCYLLLVDDDTYLTLTVDGLKCVILCTDEPSVEEVYRHKYPDQSEVEVTIICLEDSETLLNRLRLLQEQLREAGHSIAHVAIDPYKGKTAYVVLSEMITELEEGNL